MKPEDQYVDILVAWHHLEQELDAPGIIDFNLLNATESNRTYEHRLQVLNDFQRLLPHFEDEQISKKITAHIYYLRALMGQQIPFSEYIENTQHILVKMFEDEYLDKVRDDLTSSLETLGVQYNQTLVQQLEALDEFIPQDKIKAFFLDQFAEHKVHLEKALDREVDYNLNLEIVNVPEYWSNWVDGSGNNFRLRINYHAGEYTKTRALILVYHELLAHCAQMAIWKEQIDGGEMSKVWGLTTVHGPEQFLFEGLAQTLPLYLPNEVTEQPLLRAQMLLNRYELLVWNNLHIMINSGKAIEKCLEYGVRMLPWTAPKRIIAGLKSRSNHVLFRSYLYVYPISLEWFVINSINIQAIGFSQIYGREPIFELHSY